MKLVLLVLGSFLVGPTILSHVRSAKWWIRYADFPRVQIAFGLASVLATYVALHGFSGARDALFALAIAGALVDQGIRIFPFTPLAPKEVAEARLRSSATSIRILISNVMMETGVSTTFWPWCGKRSRTCCSWWKPTIGGTSSWKYLIGTTPPA